MGIDWYERLWKYMVFARDGSDWHHSHSRRAATAETRLHHCREWNFASNVQSQWLCRTWEIQKVVEIQIAASHAEPLG